MKFLLCAVGALLCISAVTAFPKPRKDVPPQCADPTFACQDLANARVCGVVKTCIHDIWSTMSVPDDNDEICDICKEMVKEARDQLLSNMTQEEIKEVFEGSCKLLPIKLIADACIKVVDEIIPELVEMLASRMDPNMVCTVSGMCFATHTTVENPVMKYLQNVLNQHKGDQCQECTTMVSDLQVFLKDTPKKDVKTDIEKLCAEKVPAYLCNLLIGDYFPEMYDYISNTKPLTLCSTAGICPQKCEVTGNKPAVNDELTCEFCEHVLQHVKDLITTNTTMEEFRDALLNFCNHTGSFHTRCTDMVNNYYDMLFGYIKNLDTKGMCTLMGLCSNTKCSTIPLVKLVPAEEAKRRIPLIQINPPMTNYIKAIPLVRLIPAETLSKKQMKDSNDIFPQLPLERLTLPSPIFEKDTECAFCKAISFYIKEDLKGNLSKTSVRKAIDEVCEKWVKDFPDHCTHFVNKYSMKFQVAVAKGIDFEDVCPSMKACPLEEKKSELEVKVLQNTVGASPFCDLCKDAMGEVEKQLSDPSTKQKLENLLDQACNIVPKGLRDDCVSFINQNVDALIDILQQELKPDNICPALGLCAVNTRITVLPRVKDLECDVCKDVITNLRQKLEDPGSKKIVLTFLEEGCARLPASISQECKQFVDENIDTVMAMIIEELDPSTVCSILKICTDSLIEQTPVKSNDLECELCKEVVGKVEDLIKDKKTEEEIKSALDKVCSYLPSSMTAKCEAFVNTYTDMLITLITQELDPTLICKSLGVCSDSMKKPKPAIKSNIECELCKELVSKVEGLVKDKKTEDEIKSALDKVCHLLPSKFATKCEKFVNDYTELLITLIATEADPGMVCAALKVCPAKEQFAERLSKAVDIECKSCQYILHFIQAELMSADVQTEIKNLLKKVCNLLPKAFSDNCEAYFDEFGDSLLVLVAQEIDPSSLCNKLKLCGSKTLLIPVAPIGSTAHDAPNPLLHSFKIDECSVCTTVVDYLDKLLEEDDVDKEITNIIQKVCNVLPASYKPRCSTILETYGSYILQMIGQLADSKTVCQDIDMCASTPGHVQLIGGNKCTFGPSYWCRSANHASACKAQEYCKDKMWKN